MGSAIAFYFFGILAIVLALATILHKNVFKSATFLAGMLFCTAALFVTLDAEFLAVVQVLVYIGAITILIVFAIMLTMRISDESREQFNAQKLLAPVIVLGVLGLIVLFLLKGQWSAQRTLGLLPEDTLGDIGQALISYFILPFDVVTVLLLIALVGATYLAKQDDYQPLVQEVDAADAEKARAEKEVENPEIMVH